MSSDVTFFSVSSSFFLKKRSRGRSLISSSDSSSSGATPSGRDRKMSIRAFALFTKTTSSRSSPSILTRRGPKQSQPILAISIRPKPKGGIESSLPSGAPATGPAKRRAARRRAATTFMFVSPWWVGVGRRYANPPPGRRPLFAAESDPRKPLGDSCCIVHHGPPVAAAPASVRVSEPEQRSGAGCSSPRIQKLFLRRPIVPDPEKTS